MSDQDLDYEAIREKIDSGVSRQRWSYRFIFFGMNLFFYLVSMITVWGVLLTNPSLRSTVFNEGSAAPLIVIIPSVLWGMMVLSHMAALFIESKAGEKNIRERLLMREVGEEILRKGLMEIGMQEKPKRRAAVAAAHRPVLSDDGEVAIVEDDEHSQQSDRKARTNHAGQS